MKKKFRVYHKDGKLVGALGNEDSTTEIPNTDGFILLEMEEGENLEGYSLVADKLIKRPQLKLTVPESVKAGSSCNLVIELLNKDDEIIKSKGKQVSLELRTTRGKLSELNVKTKDGRAEVGYTAVDETVEVTISASSEEAVSTSVTIQLVP